MKQLERGDTRTRGRMNGYRATRTDPKDSASYPDGSGGNTGLVRTLLWQLNHVECNLYALAGRGDRLAEREWMIVHIDRQCRHESDDIRQLAMGGLDDGPRERKMDDTRRLTPST